MEIKAADVMKLRQMTGAGMMDCKKALIEAECDYDLAHEIIREKGKLVAAKRADRETTEGAVLARIDGQKEMSPGKEANRLKIPVIARVDTCCDPPPIDYVVPANDDAAKAIAYIMDVMCAAINEGVSERKLEKEKEAETAEEKPVAGKKLRARKGAKAEEPAAEAPAAETPAEE